MQPRPPYPRATTHPPPRPYAQRPLRQFTPLGMTLTRAFEKLKDGGLIVHLAPRPLPHLRSSKMVVWSFIWRHALCHILFLHIFSPMSIAYIIRFRGTILRVVRHSIMRYRTWSIQGWSTWLGQVWPPILCLRILHLQFLLLLVFSRLIWMLMVLMVAWYFGIFLVEDLVQLTWVHHFTAV